MKLGGELMSVMRLSPQLLNAIKQAGH
jgi:hypothetical protein